MDSKFKAVAIAYKNIDEKTKEKILYYSVRIINEMHDLEPMATNTRMFDADNRVDIYVEWFAKEIEKKLKENYEVAILELPKDFSDEKMAMLDEMDIEYKENILVLDRVDV